MPANLKPTPTPTVRVYGGAREGGKSLLAEIVADAFGQAALPESVPAGSMVLLEYDFLFKVASARKVAQWKAERGKLMRR